MQPLRDYADEVYTRWLASVFVCCAPRAKKQHQMNRGGSDASFMTWGLEKDDRIYQGFQSHDDYHHQPQYMPSPKMQSYPQRPRTRSSVHPTEWVDRTRTLASRASSRGSMYIRRRSTKKPTRRLTIGQPMDFRKVEDALSPMEVFQPLELSIYTPQNFLEPLPNFTASDTLDGPECPTKALIWGRTASVLSTTPSEFRIPRKPVQSIQGLSMYGDQRRSVDTKSTPSTLNSEWTIQPLKSRPGLPVSPSTQELLEALQQRLPQEPPALRARSNTEPAAVLQRRSSEQIQRVKAAIEHKQELEATLAKVSKKLSLRKKNVKLVSDPLSPVIQEAELEDPPPVPSKSPLITRSTTTVAPKRSSRLVRSATFSGLSSLLYRPLPPTPLNFSPSPASNQPQPPPLPLHANLPKPAAFGPSTESDYPAPLQIPSRNRSIHRVTKWLFTPVSMTEITPPSNAKPSHENFYKCTDPLPATELAPYAPTISSRNSGTSRLSGASASILTWNSTEEGCPKPQTETPVSTSVEQGPPGRTRTFGKADRRVMAHQPVASVTSIKDKVEVLVKQDEQRVLAVGVAY